MEDTVEAFDPSTFPPRWSSARRMSRARANHKLMALPDHGCILALGGRTRDGVDSSIERYDPQQEEWTEVTSSPRAGEQTSPAALRLPKALTNFACVRLDALQFDLENEQKSGETKILSDHRAARAEWEIFAKAVDVPLEIAKDQISRRDTSFERAKWVILLPTRDLELISAELKEDSQQLRGNSTSSWLAILRKRRQHKRIFSSILFPALPREDVQRTVNGKHREALS
ncbi:hypothetical protein GUITHDRAFT_99239 [Guillardia theta CCMP2712]|uniref:Uncharacterized protein n=1 Tax=Guillardia theta (strain CCMP2712) TaxID=905079 RepID=L1K4F0_GUITC|nr:hypothetical protein GUITHDRAFT_99239 [Guillardia theta CCMP2712]EKX55462.1 hypothetical protein GUITHDRAFT_99239 [Guillardia theta CCMP2712]|eukprot:XP_005842442.1 hypothetical protein GUITHDRAFT_99239 [Guillardia theta CCMP2712]